jgi:hypothetical protein
MERLGVPRNFQAKEASLDSLAEELVRNFGKESN